MVIKKYEKGFSVYLHIVKTILIGRWKALEGKSDLR